MEQRSEAIPTGRNGRGRQVTSGAIALQFVLVMANGRGRVGIRLSCQWANMPGSRWVIPSQHRLARLYPCSRLYFLGSQRSR
jgi:hypothetical protein